MTDIQLLLVVFCLAACFFAGVMGYRHGYES